MLFLVIATSVSLVIFKYHGKDSYIKLNSVYLIKTVCKMHLLFSYTLYSSLHSINTPESFTASEPHRIIQLYLTHTI